MRLSSIKLAGFKSFSEAVTLEFPADRTALVGPNGCGKSNVIDAIRWVLGESSPSGMRSDAMADVIFNGTDNNPPRGQALVEMTFTNHKKQLSGKYQALEQVKIKRVIERERESRYYINDAPCRRKDITELFAGMGITGKAGYAIVTQGEVHTIIESKGERLREIIEEAADISVYLNKRKETLLKIKHTKDNLRALRLATEEVYGRMKQLEKQAEQATLFQRSRDELLLLKQQQTIANYNKMCRDKAKVEQLTQKLVAEIDKEKNNTYLWLLQKEQQTLDLASHKDKLAGLLHGQQQLASQIANLEAKLTYGTKDLATKERNLNETQGELKSRQTQARTASKVLAEAQAEFAELGRSHQQLPPGARQEQQQLEEALAAADEDWQTLLNNEVKLQGNLNLARQKLAELQSLLAQQQTELAELNLQVAEQERSQQELKQLQQENATLATKLKQLQKKAAAEQTKLAKLAAKAEKLAASKQQLTAAHLQLNTRLEELNAKDRAPQLSPKLKQVLAALKINPSTIWGEELNVAAGWEKAIDAVAAPILQANLTANLNLALETMKQGDYKLALISAKTTASGTATDENFAKLKSLTELAATGQAPDFFRHIYACPDLATASKLQPQLKSHQSLVTSRGDWIGSNWAVLQSTSDSSYSLAAKKRREQLQQQISKLAAKLTQVDQSSRQTQSDTAECQKNLAALQTENAACQALKIKNERLIFGKQAVQQAQQTPSYNSQQKTAELDKLAKQIQQQQQQLQQLTEQAELQATEKQAIENKRRELSSGLRTLQEAQAQALANNEQAQTAREELLAKITRLESGKIEFEKLQARLQVREQELLKEVYAGRRTNQAEASKLQELSKKHKENQALLSKQEKEVAKFEESLTKLDRDLAKSERNIAVHEEKINQTKEEQQKLDLELVDLEKRLPPDIKLSELQEPAQIRVRINQLERRLSSLGAVNMLALEEYAEVQKKYQQNQQQEAEIKAAMDNLHKAIKRVDRESKKKFERTFRSINQNFAKLFAVLTDGGKASLELAELEDQTSVRILASPPGKRNTSLSLLSGGEKTVTALAFIMAIFQLNPAPFCIMDEADAMLDDYNILRFNNMIDKLATESDLQFILITHSKLSMKEAKHLVGITMSEPGISRVVSVDMNQALALSAEA